MAFFEIALPHMGASGIYFGYIEMVKKKLCRYSTEKRFPRHDGVLNVIDCCVVYKYASAISRHILIDAIKWQRRSMGCGVGDFGQSRERAIDI
jgi:hypothetical protein